MLTAAAFMIAHKWKQPEYPPADEWMNQMWHIHTVEYFSVIRRNVIDANMDQTRNYHFK